MTANGREEEGGGGAQQQQQGEEQEQDRGDRLREALLRPGMVTAKETCVLVEMVRRRGHQHKDRG